MIVTDPLLAVDVIADARLCAIPTETVYGLGAHACNEKAIAAVFEAKGRPRNHPLIVHIPSLDSATAWVSSLPEWARELGQRFWPGPVTLVGARTSLALDTVTGQQDTVAIRVPNHPLTLTVLETLWARGIPGVVAPSANRFGHVSPTTAEHVQADLGEYLHHHRGVILDGGPSLIGVESTIVLATGQSPVVLRPGGVTRKMIAEATGLNVTEPQNPPRVSGHLDSHYAPDAHVILLNDSDEIPESPGGLIAFREVSTPAHLVRLAAPLTIEDYAADLYSALRQADIDGLGSVYVVLPHEEGLAEAIRDRLGRAAFN